jgi:repressor LexA
MKQVLTQRQSEVLEFMRQCAEEQGFPPTIQEICKQFGLASTNGVSQILDALESKGYIKRTVKGASRGIQFLDTIHKKKLIQQQVTGIKTLTIIGEGSAENPMSVFMSPLGQVKIDTDFFHGEGNLFAAVVSDDGMTAMGLYSGDTIIVRQTAHADDGDIVLALSGVRTMVRRYTTVRGIAELEPQAKGFSRTPMSPHIALVGVVIGMMRAFSD